MQSRFTIIQGGLAGTAPRAASGAGRTGLALVTEADAATAPAGWRVVLRRPHELREAETDEWRALAARTTNLDPFADPDFLATSALHAARDTAGIAFALVFATGETGIERLGGVIPLSLPHPVWGGPAVALWQAPLTPRPVEPVFAEGAAADAVAALLDHLARTNPRASLRLAGLGATGALLAELRADPRLQLADRETPAAIPGTQFVSLGTPDTVTRIERITAPDAIRDAVERFLLVDARRGRRPLLPDPAAASTLRVASRLFARRGLVEVELHTAFGEDVAAAIRLGRAGERMPWRTVGLDAAPPVEPRRVDVEIARADAVTRPAAVRLVVS